MTCPVTSQSNSIRMQARCCFTVGGENSRLSCPTYAGHVDGLQTSRTFSPATASLENTAYDLDRIVEDFLQTLALCESSLTESRGRWKCLKNSMSPDTAFWEALSGRARRSCMYRQLK
jgi:hypothetical protein